MANQIFPNAPINNPWASTLLGPDATEQQYKMQMRQRLADMLTMNGNQQPQGQMVSGHYVAPSPLQYIGGLANSALGAKIYNDMPQEQARFNDSQRAQLQQLAAQLTGGAQMTNPQANAAALANGQGPTVANAQTAAQYQSDAAAPLQGMNPNMVMQLAQWGGPQQVGEFIRQVNSPTDRVKTERSYGIGPDQGRQMYFDEQRAKSYIAPVKAGPGESLFDWQDPTKQLVSMPKDGVQTIIGPGGAATAMPVKNYGKIVSGQESDKAAGVSYGTKVGESAADADKVLYDAAQNAQKQYDTANRVIDLVNGGAMTGTGSEAMLQVAKALNVVGVNNKDTIQKTESLVSALGKNVLDNVKASGLGAGNGFTDKDRQFLEKVVGGQITLDSSTLKELARLQKLTADGAVEAFNRRYNEMPESSRTTGWKPVEIKNRYSRSELLQELKSRQERARKQNGAQ